MDLRGAAWMARCTGRGDLSPFSADEISELVRIVGARRVAAGTLLMSQGDPIQHISIIARGAVELYRRQRTRRVVLQVLHGGDVFGDIPFLCAKPVPFSARSLTDATVVELEADRLWRLLEERPHVCRRFLFSVASRLERMQRRLLELTSGDLAHQVAALLLDETGARPGSVTLAQATIAELLGSTRPSVNRVLKDFEAQQLVELSYRRIEVLDPAGLQRAAA